MPAAAENGRMRSKQEIRGIVEDYSKSGMTRREYCEKHRSRRLIAIQMLIKGHSANEGDGIVKSNRTKGDMLESVMVDFASFLSMPRHNGARGRGSPFFRVDSSLI